MVVVMVTVSPCLIMNAVVYEEAPNRISIDTLACVGPNDTLTFFYYLWP